MSSTTFSLLKYDNPLIISKIDPKEKIKKQGLKQPSTSDDILNSILPPREWKENGELWVQKVSHTPATRLDVISLQVYRAFLRLGTIRSNLVETTG